MGDLFSDFDIYAKEERISVPAVAGSADIPAEWEIDERPHHVVAVDLWPPKLPMEVALCTTLEEQEEVAHKFGLSAVEFGRIAQIPQFRRAVSDAAVVIRESGYGFKQKCRVIAEDFLGSLDLQLHNHEVGLTTKLDIFKTMAKYGELEPQPKKDAGNQNTTPTVNIQINI